MTQKIYLDCTHTYYSGLNSGIQRVVKNIVKQSPSISKELSVEIIPLISMPDGYYRFEKFAPVNKTKNSLKTHLKTLYKKLRSLLAYLLPKEIINFLHAPSFVTKCNSIADRLFFGKKIDKSKSVSLQKDDTLILIDTTWLNNNYAQLKQLKEQGVKIVALIYDIIPITHPQFCTSDLTLSLIDWYKNATPYIDKYIAISDTVKEEVYNYIKTNHIPDIKKESFDYFYLGADFSTHYDQERVPQRFKAYFKNPNTYITVSTIEPRKNHKYILDTFDSLFAQNEECAYIMIGRRGWKTQELIKRIESHKLYNKRVFLLENVDDNSLIYAYKNAKALIFASHIEGFGLPIVESLYYKLPVIASNTPIHKEIGKECISYFDPKEKNSLKHILQNATIKEPTITLIWQDWHQSAKDFISKAIKR